MADTDYRQTGRQSADTDYRPIIDAPLVTTLHTVMSSAALFVCAALSLLICSCTFCAQVQTSF